MSTMDISNKNYQQHVDSLNTLLLYKKEKSVAVATSRSLCAQGATWTSLEVPASFVQKTLLEILEDALQLTKEDFMKTEEQ